MFRSPASAHPLPMPQYITSYHCASNSAELSTSLTVTASPVTTAYAPNPLSGFSATIFHLTHWVIPTALLYCFCLCDLSLALLPARVYLDLAPLSQFLFGLPVRRVLVTDPKASHTLGKQSTINVDLQTHRSSSDKTFTYQPTLKSTYSSFSQFLVASTKPYS